jgi:hypothetical protein
VCEVAHVHRHACVHKHVHKRTTHPAQSSRLITGDVMQENSSKPAPLQDGGERIITEASGLNVSVQLRDGSPEGIVESIDAWMLRWLRCVDES